MKLWKFLTAPRQRLQGKLTLGPEQRTALFNVLVQVFRLSVKAQDAQHLLIGATDLESLVADIEPLGVAANTVTCPQGTDAGKHWNELLRRGPVLLGLAEGPVVALGVRGETIGVADLASGQVREIEMSALPATTGLQFLRLQSSGQDKEGFGWKWFSKEFFSNKAAVREALITSLVIQLIALAFPLATQAIVDKVITNQAQNTLIVMGVGIGFFALFSAVLSWLRQKLLLRLANGIDGRLAQQVFDRLVRLPLPFFEHRATGVIINRIHGVERVREFFAGAFLLVVLELPFMFVFLALMLSYSPLLSGVVAVFLAVMLALSFAVGPLLRERSNQQFQHGANLQGFMTEHVAASETLKSLQLEPHVGRRFAEINHAYLGATLRTKELGNAYGSFMQLAEQLMNVSVLCLGAYLAMTTNSLTIGMLVAFQMFASKVSQPLLKLSGYWQELQQVRTAVAQLGDVMNTPTENYSALASSAAVGRGHLQAQQLGFRYSEDRPMLYEDFNFTLEPGEVVLITGPSGCGKSTLAKILQGLYTGYTGIVRVDGRDARSMSINELRANFGVVPQEAVLFSGTIADNLLMGASGATLEQAVQACKMAGIHNDLENLPKGYLTEVGERGVGLSGGQRQRVAIARALLKRPKVLIFDESTSGLDEVSAERVAETVNGLRGKVSMLFIAHKVPKGLQVDRHVELRPATRQG
jgi:subfamily B ATP-binding cassette protein HlyB/CyaB